MRLDRLGTPVGADECDAYEDQSRKERRHAEPDQDRDQDCEGDDQRAETPDVYS
jgi:hypothetical protein